MFFKDTEDFKKYIPVSASFELPEMVIFLNDVERSILKKYIGKDLLDELKVLFDDAASADILAEPVKELVELIRVSSSNFALASWITTGQVKLSNGGAHINVSETKKTAFQWQIKAIEDSCNERGFNALEEALDFLEANLTNAAFESYKDSDEFKQNNYLFVPSAIEFCKYYSAFSNSRINFYKFRSVIRTVEDMDIKATILPDYFDDLKTTLQSGDPLGSLAQTIVDMIKPALVNLALAKGIADQAVIYGKNGIQVFDNTGGRETIDSMKTAPDNSLARLADAAHKDGKNYLKILADYLETNKASYPLFANDALYVAPTAKVDKNTGSRPFFSGL